MRTFCFFELTNFQFCLFHSLDIEANKKKMLPENSLLMQVLSRASALRGFYAAFHIRPALSLCIASLHRRNKQQTIIAPSVCAYIY